MKRSLMSCVLSMYVLFGCGASEPLAVQTSAICDPDLYAESGAASPNGREQMQCHAMTISEKCALGVGIAQAISHAGLLTSFDHGLMQCLGDAPEADIDEADVTTACGCISAAALAECMTCPTCDCMSH